MPLLDHAFFISLFSLVDSLKNNRENYNGKVGTFPDLNLKLAPIL